MNSRLTLAGCLSLCVETVLGFLPLLVLGQSPPRLEILPNQEWPRFTRGPAWDIKVVGRYAFVTLQEGGVALFDISDTTRIEPVSAYHDGLGRCFGVSISSPYAFVAAEGAGFFMFDIRDPARISRVARVETGPNAVSVTVRLPYVYVATGETGLQIFDISVPTNILKVGRYNTSGIANHVSVLEPYAFVADGPGGLVALDVSIPSKLTLAGTFQGIGIFHDIQVISNIAYAALAEAGVHVFDVSDPAHMRHLGGIDTPGIATRIQIVHPYAYIADGAGGLRVLDVSDPTKINSVGTFDINGSANGLHVLGIVAYIADGVGRIHVLNVADPGHIERMGLYEGYGTSFDVSATQDYAFVADGDAGLRVLRTGSEAITHVGRYDIPGSAMTIEVAGHSAYVAAYLGGLHAFDITDPTNVVRTSSHPPACGASVCVEVVDGTAYVGNIGPGCLQILSVSNSTMVELGQVTGLNVWDVHVFGKYALLLDDFTGLEIVDVSDPSQPSRVANFQINGEAFRFHVLSNYAYVVHSAALDVLDISDPLNIVQVGRHPISYRPTDVFAVGTRAYVPTMGGPVLVFDISQPHNVTLLRSAGSRNDWQGISVFQNKLYVAQAQRGLSVIASIPGVQLSLRAFGESNKPLTIEATEEAALNSGWEPVFTTNSIASPLDFTDLDFNKPQKFYRVRQP